LFSLPKSDRNGSRDQCGGQGRRIALAAGEELAVRYDLPTARSFATSFCQRCGSPLPHLTRSGGEAIPAGALDDDVGVKPERHLHWASRADWFADGNEIPKEE
jgi:hypothetical protein